MQQYWEVRSLRKGWVIWHHSNELRVSFESWKLVSYKGMGPSPLHFSQCAARRPSPDTGLQSWTSQPPELWPSQWLLFVMYSVCAAERGLKNTPMILLPSRRFAFTAIIPQNTAIASQPLHSFILSFVLDPHVCLCHGCSEIWSTAGEVIHCTQSPAALSTPQQPLFILFITVFFDFLDSLGTSQCVPYPVEKIETTIERPLPAPKSLWDHFSYLNIVRVVFSPVSNPFLSSYPMCLLSPHLFPVSHPCC